MSHERLTLGSERRSLDALTGLRFVAAIHVVLYHYAFGALPEGTPGVIRNVIGHGYIGVSFFYVLSGFILTYGYASIGDDGQVRLRGTRRSFLVNRFSRIYPMYALSCAIASPQAVGHRFAADTFGVAAVKLAIAVALTLGLLQSWWPGGQAWFNPPGWSVAAEAFFYLTFPWLMPWLWRRQNVMTWVLIAWLLSTLGPFAWVGAGGGQLVDSIVRYNPIFHVPTFAIGILMGRKFADPSTRHWLTRHRRWLLISATIAVLGALATPPSELEIFFANGLLAPLFGVIILALATEPPTLTRLLGNGPMVLLGHASYSIYILQAPLFIYFADLAGDRSQDLGLVAVYVVVLCAASIVGLVLVERPSPRWLRRVLDRPRPESPSPKRSGAG